MLYSRPNVRLESAVLIAGSAAVAGLVNWFERERGSPPAAPAAIVSPMVPASEEIQLNSENLPSVDRLMVNE